MLSKLTVFVFNDRAYSSLHAVRECMLQCAIVGNCIYIVDSFCSDRSLRVVCWAAVSQARLLYSNRSRSVRVSLPAWLPRRRLCLQSRRSLSDQRRRMPHRLNHLCLPRSRTGAGFVIVIVIVTTVFMVLSSWHSHCESSPGSSDEYSTNADLWTQRVATPQTGFHYQPIFQEAI